MQIGTSSLCWEGFLENVKLFFRPQVGPASTPVPRPLVRNQYSFTSIG